MLGALVGLTLGRSARTSDYWLMIPLVLRVRRCCRARSSSGIGVRPAIKIKSEFGWIMSTIALGIIFKNVAENIWGRDDLKFPSPLPETRRSSRRRPNVLPMEIADRRAARSR